MNWFANNLIETILILGIILLIVEVAVLGFSTFFLFFVGLAAIATSLLMWANIIPEAFLYGIGSTAAFTLMFAALLWKPMVNMQKSVDNTRATSDLIGHSFVLSDDVIASSPIAEKPSHQFSGVQWRLQSTADINKGSLVEVFQIDVGVLWVKLKIT